VAEGANAEGHDPAVVSLVHRVLLQLQQADPLEPAVLANTLWAIARLAITDGPVIGALSSMAAEGIV